MQKKGQIVNTMLMITIGLIIGVAVVFAVINSIVSDATSTTAVSNVNFTATNNTCVRLTTSCITPTSIRAYNFSDFLDRTGNFTECGDSSSTFGLTLTPSDPLSGAKLDGQIMASNFSQRSCGFIGGGTTTTVINLLPLLFAVALLVFVAGFMLTKK